MIKLIFKTTLLILIVCCSALVTKAQLGYDFAQYDIGVAVGFNQVYGDAETVKQTNSIHFNFTYNTTPYTNFIFEAQLGRLAGGDVNSRSGRKFNNDFTSLVFRGQLQGGEFLDYRNSKVMNFFKNLYVSAGIGYIINNIPATDINRTSTVVPGFYTPGENKSNEPFIPLKIGYEIKLFNTYDQPSFKIDLGYQYNYVLGDGVDGFIVGNPHDKYTQVTLGVKFALGGLTSYRKKIPY
ncbi:hypothetical protein BH09BAC6_BH09BAC6_23440 [soil metagenome]